MQAGALRAEAALQSRPSSRGSRSSLLPLQLELTSSGPAETLRAAPPALRAAPPGSSRAASPPPLSDVEAAGTVQRLQHAVPTTALVSASQLHTCRHDKVHSDLSGP